MTKPRKNRCQTIVLNAIEAAIPWFKHLCTRTSHKAVFVHGSMIDEYCTVVNGTSTKTTLLPTGQYEICRNLKYHDIDTNTNTNNLTAAIPKNGNAAASNNNTNAAILNPPGVTVANNNTKANPPVSAAVVLLCCPGPRSQNRKQ